MKFELPPLPYATNALEPYIDATTMQLHHAKHHQTYLDKFKKAIEGTDLEGLLLEDILRKVSNHGPAVRNHGGGYYNHNLFWPMLKPNGGGTPMGSIGEAIVGQFGSFENFKQLFTQAAMDCFGSGWAWLCKNTAKGLYICSTANQDNPIMDVVEPLSQGIPLLGLDVWEHAYYLNYQNRRLEYIEAFWNIVNWEEVERRLDIPTLPTR
jgi:Fe-Mn family superoxide dismutase